MRGMRHSGYTAALFALVVGCGGSTSTDPQGSGGSGGTKPSGGSSGTATGGVGNVGGGGSGGITGGSGGIGGGVGGGCASTCGPAGSPCCAANDACANTDPNGGTIQCACTPELIWECSGTGGVGGCDPSACGPTGAPCCGPGSGCGTAAGGGPGISCYCTPAGYWDCEGGGFGGTGGGGNCGNGMECSLGTTCCGASCVNTLNDPFNCGGCANVCAASPQFCGGGICTKPPCFANEPPPPSTFCCGQTYCKQGQLCCDVQGPGPTAGPICFTPTPSQPTCPIGCPTCQ